MQYKLYRSDSCSQKDLKNFESLVLCGLKKDFGFEAGSGLNEVVPAPLLKIIAPYVKRRHLKMKPGGVVSVDASPSLRVVLVCPPKDPTATFEWHEQARRIVSSLRSFASQHVGVFTTSAVEDSAKLKFAESLAASAEAFNFKLPNRKSKKSNHSKSIKSIHFNCEMSKNAAEQQKAIAQANNLARSLTVRTPDDLSCETFVNEAKALAAKYNLKTKFYSRKALEKMGAGAFVAVAQASEKEEAGILRLDYTPNKSKKPTGLLAGLEGVAPKLKICFVGKGIVFDTGGVNLKPSSGLRHMKGDMGGAAVALGLIKLAALCNWPFQVSCFLAISDNLIGPNAYYPDQVVQSLSGKSIEIIHTDAEGRMVLSDTLTLASREKPDYLFDFATLTGSAVGAIGTRYGAAMTNQDAWHDSIRQAGKESGERVWSFPLDDDFGECLKSSVADIKQCRLSGGQDHIEAAYFLKQFIEGSPKWLHLDLSAERNEGGLGAIPSNFTGFGLRFVERFLFQELAKKSQ